MKSLFYKAGLFVGSAILAVTTVQAQDQVSFRWGNVEADCNSNQVVVALDVMNTDAATYGVKGSTVRFDFNSDAIASPWVEEQNFGADVVKMTENRDGVWSYGHHVKDNVEQVAANGEWNTVAKIGFKVRNGDAPLDLAFRSCADGHFPCTYISTEEAINGSFSLRVGEMESLTTSFNEVCKAASSITEVESLEIANIYPNPATEFAYITANGDLTNALVKVYDAQGKLVVVTSEMEGEKLVLNVSSLSSGAYQVTMNIAGKSFVKTLIVG